MVFRGAPGLRELSGVKICLQQRAFRLPGFETVPMVKGSPDTAIA
jgi:hypothetical protein